MISSKLALFDIDNTLYSGHVVTDFPKYLVERGIIGKVIVHLQSEDYKSFKNGEIDYEDLAKRWLIAMADGLKGLSVEEVSSNINSFFDNTLFDYFKPIVTYLYKKNYNIYIVSGEPKFVSDYFVEKFELSGELSSTFEIQDNKFTGEVVTLLSNKAAKHEALTDLFKKYDLADSLAFGDSVVDLEMLGRVDIPVCVNPSIQLKKIANQRNWIVTSTHQLYNTIVEII